MPSWRSRLDVPRVPRSNDRDRRRRRRRAGPIGGSVEPTVVRAALGLLTLAGGIGVVLYGLAALASTPPVRPRPRRRAGAPRRLRRELAVACATGGDPRRRPGRRAVAGRRHHGSPPRRWPSASSSCGRARTAGRPRSGRAWVGRGLQIVAGVVLLAAGVISLANRTGGLANVGASAGAIAVVVGGLAMFAAPAVGRLLRSLDEERAMRIREDERAAVAAHLHDSVLQSLVLIQRSDDPRRMASLARRQERELRAWLYGATEPGDPTSLHAAVEALTVEIEADHDIRVEAVIVGDQPLDDAARTLVGALREALVNAARHADVDRVDVFVEADDAELTGVRPRHRAGLRPGGHPRRSPRHQRLDRRAPAARRRCRHAARRSPGVGTEIELRVPRSRR